MPRTVAKASYNVRDMWEAFIKEKLATNPEWWTKKNYTWGWSRFSLWKLENGRPVEVMSYERFNKIIRAYFNRAKKAIIKGEAVNMQAGVGKICARRVERDFRKKKQRNINWPRTKLQPLVWSEKKQRLEYANTIYFVEDEWCRIGWHKTESLANETVYEFKPTAVSSDKKHGFTMEFSTALKANPLLKYQYLYFPLDKSKIA